MDTDDKESLFPTRWSLKASGSEWPLDLLFLMLGLSVSCTSALFTPFCFVGSSLDFYRTPASSETAAVPTDSGATVLGPQELSSRAQCSEIKLKPLLMAFSVILC